MFEKRNIKAISPDTFYRQALNYLLKTHIFNVYAAGLEIINSAN